MKKIIKPYLIQKKKFLDKRGYLRTFSSKRV